MGLALQRMAHPCTVEIPMFSGNGPTRFFADGVCGWNRHRCERLTQSIDKLGWVRDTLPFRPAEISVVKIRIPKGMVVPLYCHLVASASYISKGAVGE